MVFQAYGVTSQLPYARAHESSADEVGLLLMAAACFNPDEAVPLWERMEAQLASAVAAKLKSQSRKANAAADSAVRQTATSKLGS